MKKWIILLVVCLSVALFLVYAQAPSEVSAPPVEPSAEPNLPDSDGDGMSDWFEENIAHLDPLVPNDRYAIILNTLTIQEREKTTNLKTFLVEEEKFKSESIFLLMDKEATYDNFEKAINSVANISDENDLVYIMIQGHGSENAFSFHSGKDPSEIEITDEYLESVRDRYAWGYEEYWERGGKEEARKNEQIRVAASGYTISPGELSELLSKIRSKKMLLTVECCGARGFVDKISPRENTVIIGRQFLEGIAETLIRSVVAPDAIYRKLLYQSEEYRNRESSLINLDDGNTYPSVTEVLAACLIDHLIIPWREVCEKNGLDCEKVLAMTDVSQIIEYITTFESNLKEVTPKMIDPQGIADDFYFGEAKIGKYRSTTLYELSP